MQAKRHSTSAWTRAKVEYARAPWKVVVWDVEAAFLVV